MRVSGVLAAFGLGLFLAGLLDRALAPLVMVGAAALAASVLSGLEPVARGRVVSALLGAGWENVAALMAAAGVAPRAVYYPSRLGGGRAVVVVGGRPAEVPRGAFTLRGDGGGVALVLVAPGSRALELCGELPGDLGEAVRSCLSGLGLASSASAVVRPDGSVVVEVSRPYRLDYGAPLASVLGSPVASVAAAVAAEVLGRPLEFVEERWEGGGRLVVVLR